MMNAKKEILKNTMIPSIISWLLLIALTLISVYMTSIITSRSLLISCALIIVFLKAQQIIDIFMELKHAPKPWRLVLLSYIFLVPLILTIIYLF